MYEDVNHHEHEDVNHHEHPRETSISDRNGQEQKTAATEEQNSNRRSASEQHSNTTSDQATLHDTWRPNLCIQDLG